MSIRFAFAALLCAFIGAGLLPAADDSTVPDQPAAEQSAPAKTALTTKTEAANAAPRNFKQAFDEFKQLLGKLRSLQSRFFVAKESDRPQILAEFAETVAKGDQLVPGLYASAIQTFQADPKDREAAEFLLANLKDAVEAERFTEGASLAKVLADGGYTDNGFANYAGIAEFCTNDFARAKTDLKNAVKDTSIDDYGRKMLPQVDECARLWKVERLIRDAEEKADDLPRVRLTTTKGDIVVELFENEAPNTTANFINLVEQHFYDGLKFHRVMPGFMAQVGDPNTGGKAALDYTIPCECIQDNSRKHFAGSLSMANAGPNTGNSQFFLTFAPRPELNGKHTVFGRVIEGFDVLARIQRVDPDNHKVSVTPDEIVKATVIRKRDHEYKPKTNPK
jgi:cyclophilin family peptidyl-prolyl cis-trans isomerase